MQKNHLQGLILCVSAVVLLITEEFGKKTGIINMEAQTYAVLIYLCLYLFVGFLVGVFVMKFNWKIKSEFHYKEIKADDFPNFNNVIDARHHFK